MNRQSLPACAPAWLILPTGDDFDRGTFFVDTVSP